MPAILCKSRELAPPSTSFTRPRPTSTVSGSTWSSASRFSLAGFSALSVEVLTSASFFRRLAQAMAPSPLPSARNGMVGNPGNSDIATSMPLASSSGMLVAISLLPGLPTIPFLALGSGLGAIAWAKRRKNDAEVKTSTESAEEPAKENLEALLQVDPLTVEVGLGLVKLVEGGANSRLLQRIAGIRKNLASQLGYYLPPVKVNDNLSLRSREYTVLIKGVEMGRFEMPAGQELAIPSAGADGSIEGKATKDPAFQLAALWIPSERATLARGKGY